MPTAQDQVVDIENVSVGALLRPSTNPVFRRLVKPAPQNTWFVSIPAANPEADLVKPSVSRYRAVDSTKVGEVAQAGDRVLIQGKDVQTIVTTCDELLHRGVAVWLDCGALPALKPLASRQESGVDWVELRPTSVRMPQILSRALDICAGLIGAVLTLPALAVLMAAIRATSPGPAIFRSPRVGRAGAIFDLYKLRTMRICESSDSVDRKEKYRQFMSLRPESADKSLKVVDASRVTRIGSFLRKHSLDELPQFWNVVRGELSLVGPRPCLPYEWDLHEDWHRLRFRSRPGLTGVWQVYGRSRVTFEEMVLMDYCYSWRKSVSADLGLIFRTAWVVITGEGGG